MASLWSETLGSFDTSTISSRSSGCDLSPAASAFSAILSALIGSVVNGLTNGWFVAFMTGWIAWLAIFRVLVGGLYMFYHSITDSWGPGRSSDFVDPPIAAPTYYSHGGAESPPRDSLVADENVYTSGWQAIPVSGRDGQVPMAPKILTHRQIAANIWPSPAVVRGLDQPLPGSITSVPLTRPGAKQSILTPRTDLDRNVTALGWVSLAYTALFAPITQILFVAANASRHDIGAAKIVKGLTVAVTALPLCIDCRVRYADSLKWGRYVFNVFVSLSCLLQGAICATLLITGVLDLSQSSRTGPPWPAVAIIYFVFALIWMAGSFVLLPMRDGGRKGAGATHWAMYILDVGMGAFAGLFLAAPAFVLYSNATFANDSSGMSDLVAYLSCESQAWRKFAAVAP
ncbi:hypothetical protein C8A03DRAFT_35545 [Achaetomium macrosporum]|uniref:Uncharacterized protein n=1 Tax=Achaetomium macrosporum TaxID=79813 RepID=A0AAN7C8X8_9PEZI|nr:hypothetical protein C8A03DRAFT_35545 [Achaetomium macrosporum]